MPLPYTVFQSEAVLIVPEPSRLEERSRFAIRGGNRTVGAGVVTEIVE